MKKLIQWFIHFTRYSRRRTNASLLVIFLMLVLPLTVVSYLNYRDLRGELIGSVLKDRETRAELAAKILEERFAGQADVGRSLANRLSVVNAMDNRDWAEALNRIKGITREFAYIDRIFIADTEGVVQVGYPDMPEVVGKEFAYRDWFKGVSQKWEPYMSEAYRRAILPEINVAVLAVPLRNNNNEVVGILALQKKLDIIDDWARHSLKDDGSFLYFTDQSGHPIGHPHYPSQEPLADFSQNPFVAKALQGEAGAEIITDGETGEKIIGGYASVSRFGWTAIVEGNSENMFSALNRNLLDKILLIVISFAFSVLFIYFVLNILAESNNLRQSQESLLESIGDGVVAVDRDFNIILWNKMAGVITGFSAHEALGRPFREMVKLRREADHSENLVFLEEAMLYGVAKMMENNTLLVTKDGREVPVADSAAPVFDMSGKVIGVIIVFRDVTKERMAEKAQKEFVSLASHQLRAPLTGIKWTTELLLGDKAGKLTKKQKSLIANIDASNDSLTKLVNSLLNSTRIDSGAFAIEPEPTDFEILISTVVKELKPTISEKALKFEVHFDEGTPVVEADPKLTKMIIQNLISNAVRYTPPKGKIIVSLSKKDEHLVFEVTDTGVGIPKEEQGQVFAKLWRASNAEGVSKEGTGLGLYIVKSILDQAGGKIWFESKENQGTTFHVSLPLTGMKKKAGNKALA